MSDDMKTIATLLGNLIERVESIEKGVANTDARLVKQDEAHKEFYNSLAVSQNELIGVINRVNEAAKNLTSAMSALKLSVENREPDYGTKSRHAELDHWTKDLSTKLSIMQGEIDKIKIATKRRGMFFS